MSVRRSRRSARPLGLLAGALVLLLAGCAEDEPEPKFAEPSESPTASASPAAVEETPEEFIRRWAETERDMLNTGETEAYEAMFSGCSSCQAVVDSVTAYYAEGGWIKWDGMSVERIAKRAPLVYEARVSAAPTRYKESRSGPVKGYPGGVTKFQFELRDTDQGLVVANLVLRPV